MKACKISSSYAEIIPLLIENEADVNERNNDEETALYQALFWGNTKNLKLLLQNGSDFRLAESTIDNLYDDNFSASGKMWVLILFISI